MKLIGLHVENFGTLQNFDLKPGEGLNVLYQKNGWGKSTLAVFIKAMFYGLPASRKTLDDNERKKYAPWQGGAYGGSLDFSCAKGIFRIERFFGAKESADQFALYDLSTNKPSEAFSAAVGEELFGIDADGFERSTYLSQRVINEKKENSSISARLGSLLDDVDDMGSYESAMEALEKRRRFYTMTGNRGAIAESEQNRLEMQGELERCMRVAEAMEAQRKELASCREELEELRRRSEESGAKLREAGLSREKAALIEQKNKMQAEIAALREEKYENDKFFRNLPPSQGELQENRRLYEALRESSARLEAIPTESPNLEELKKLRSVYPADREFVVKLERAEMANDALRELRIRRENLVRESRELDAELARFPEGVPTDEALEKAASDLEQSAKLQRNTARMAEEESRIPAGSLLVPFGIPLALLGIGGVICGFLPFGVSMAALFWILGGAMILGGGIMAAVGLHRQSVNRRCREESIHSRTEMEYLSTRLANGVRALLERYGIEEGTSAAGLTRLSMLTARHHEAYEKRSRIAEEVERLDRIYKENLARVCGYLKRFFGASLALKDDYRGEFEKIREERTRLAHLEMAERDRVESRKREQATMEELKAQLLPFLQRYDPSGKMRAGDCLDVIGGKLVERIGLSRRIVEKEVALRDFLAEKQLDPTEDTAGFVDIEALSANDREIRGKIETAQQREAALKSSIEHLSADAERVPDLQAQVEALKAQTESYRDSAAVIAHAEQFLAEAKTSLSTRYLGGMQKSFGDFLGALNQEKAPEATMDTSFEVRLREGGATRTMESFSKGWRDAVQFCLHLSLTEALFAEGETPFLMLDDPFVNLDDQRLAASKALLEKLAEKYQILYFVCHKERI